MVDLLKPIPNITLPGNRLPVGAPSQEPLVYLDDEFICSSAYNHWAEDNGNPLPGSSPSIMARETVCKMLHEAEALLPEGCKFKILDAYRPVAVQQSLYDYFRAQKAEEHPEWDTATLDEQILLCVSFPSYNALLPSLHNTGGAVDLTIVGPDGEELEMGCGFDEFTDRAWADYYEPDSKWDDVNDVARDNRRILHNAMIAVGFTMFPSEWWHFDYGDEKWALNTNNVPIYAGILDADQRNTVPYNNQELVKETTAKENAKIEQLLALRNDCAAMDAEVAKVMKG